MRRLLLASVVVMIAAPASAQMTVIDPAVLAQSTQSVAQGGLQLAQMANQLAVLRSQYQQLISTYQAVAHLPSAVVAEAGSLFAVPALRSPVPGMAADLGSIVGGTGSVNALTGTISGLMAGNRVYAPVGVDAQAQRMNTNAASIAGTQAMAQQLFQSATEHAAALWTLEAELANSPDAKATADIQGRLQMEQAHLQARVVQAQTLQAAQSAQVRQTAQQHEESRRCYIDAMLAGGDGSSGSCATMGTGASGDGSMVAVSDVGASVATGYEQYLGQKVGTGQCVALVQAADSSVGLTATWSQGSQVQGNTSLVPGTAIATFNGAGKYANATDGSSHAAIYLGQNAEGMQVQDQWLGHAASVRTIAWNGNNQANSGSAFYVIGHGGT